MTESLAENAYKPTNRLEYNRARKSVRWRPALCVNTQWICYMNGQGFMAATSIKLDGKRSVIAERAMLSDPSSSG